MIHREAEEHLVALAEGALDGPLLEELTAHVEECSECQSWMETYGFLASSVSRPSCGDHPSSELMALCAVRAEEEYELDRSDLHEHLDECGHCRNEIDLVRAALRQARPAAEKPAPQQVPWFSHGLWWKAAAAAVLVGVAIVVLIEWSTRLGGGPAAREPSLAATHLSATEAGSAADVPETEISEQAIDGERVIRTEGRLTISSTKITPGAVVTIQAAKTVAFGNGFEIGPHARVEVGVDPTAIRQGTPGTKGGGTSNG